MKFAPNREACLRLRTLALCFILFDIMYFIHTKEKFIYKKSSTGTILLKNIKIINFILRTNISFNSQFKIVLNKSVAIILISYRMNTIKIYKVISNDYISHGDNLTLTFHNDMMGQVGSSSRSENQVLNVCKYHIGF